jgi:hypothetical protein
MTKIGATRRRPRWRCSHGLRALIVVITLASITTALGCGDDGDDPPPPAQPTPDNWDQMSWDQGQWQ